MLYDKDSYTNEAGYSFKLTVTVKNTILATRAGLVTRTGASLGQGSLFEL